MALRLLDPITDSRPTLRHARHWVGGDRVDAPGPLRDSFDPATGERNDTCTEAGETEAQRAIAVAPSTFRQSPWREDRRLRAKVINEMADRFEAASDNLIDILSLENGKVKSEARFEVEMVPRKLRFYAALEPTNYGRAMETAPGKYTMALREPMGVAGIIAPWESEKGGYKQSGLGRLNGASAIEDFVEYRTIIHEVKL